MLLQAAKLHLPYSVNSISQLRCSPLSLWYCLQPSCAQCATKAVLALSKQCRQQQCVAASHDYYSMLHSINFRNGSAISSTTRLPHVGQRCLLL